MFAPSEFAPNFQRTLTAFAPKYTYYLGNFSFFKREKSYAYYLEYFSVFKHEKRVTMLVIGGGELGGCELGWERNLHHSGRFITDM